MTPNETHLVDAMASALSRGSPDVASNLKTVGRPMDLGRGVSVCGDPNMIIISAPGGYIVTLTPDMFQALERFAEQIGWRPQ